ncbi:MAG: P-II family nitrogen regulator [Halioglobus sp.]
MKKIEAFVHHIRSAAVVDALHDAGVVNITLFDVKGTLNPIHDAEQQFSTEVGVAIISEVRISFICEDADITRVVDIVRKAGRIGRNVSGWVYVSPVDQAIPIGGPDP